MLLAVPAIISAAFSTSNALRSCIFCSAISLHWVQVTWPTLVRLGSPEPELIPAAFFSSTAAGGVLVMKVKDLSWYTVISTGIIVPAFSCVAALKALQNSIILIPASPKAVPTGGAGLGWPPRICSLRTVYTFLAMMDYYVYFMFGSSRNSSLSIVILAKLQVHPGSHQLQPGSFDQKYLLMPLILAYRAVLLAQSRQNL